MATFLDQCQGVIETLPKLAADLFHIRTETQGVTTCRANEVQRDYHADRCRRGFACSDEILKARKLGFSTWKELEGLALALLVDGFSGLIMGDEKEKTTKLFNIVKLAYERLPEEIKTERKLDFDRRDLIQIGASTLYITTAGGKDPARGDTLHWAHLTEVAFYDDYDRIYAGVAEALAEGGKAAHLCRESTAKGRNHWYDICKAAREGASPSKFYFYKWWAKASNHLALSAGEVIVPTDEEEFVINIAAQDGYSLTPQQLKWRRWKNLPTELGAKHEDEEGEFAQEHPEDFESAFLVGGRPLFKPYLLKRLTQEAAARWQVEKTYLPGNGLRTVWKKAGDKYPYVIGVDVAEGRAHGDWTVLSVWECGPEFVNVAREKRKCNIADAVAFTEQLGREYHNALIIVERNTYGAAVNQKLEEKQYPSLYRELDRDGQETDTLGWYTTQRSKRLMVEDFRIGVNAGEVQTYDPELVGEMMNIQLDDEGKPQTPRNKHDDHFMAACLAYQGREQAKAATGSFIGVGSYA